MINGGYDDKIAEASKMIFSFCRARTSNREDAEDLSQDILLELVRSSGNIRNSDAFYGFMWAVANNVYKQWCRKKARLKTCELTEDIPSEETFDREDEEDDIYLLRRELTLLSEKYRRAVILYYIEKRSCCQISHILNISESMVKYLLFKSRQILKEGMNMERKLGTLSYAPKTLVPLYNGTGPNLFWDFMQGMVRQNIVNACYNDSLTAEQISLETGIPLPYLDNEIKALTDRGIMLQNGKHYKTNVIIITSECADEISRGAAPYQLRIEELISGFMETGMEDFRKIGFKGSEFSERTLRWLMMTFILRAIASFNNDVSDFPITAWGDRAYIWLAEKNSRTDNSIFNYSQVMSRSGDQIYFVDYLPAPKSDHRDFYNNSGYTNILCDIARGHCDRFGENDLEAAAELIKKGYIIRENNSFKSALPIFTAQQYDDAVKLVKELADKDLASEIKGLDELAARILGEHTPKHLQAQVEGISRMDRFINAVCIPAKHLIDKKVLDTDWEPLEMPTAYVVLKDK